MIFDKMIIVGAGGTGSILIPQVVRYLNAINFQGELIIADGDTYEDSNMDRQSFAQSKVGMNKAQYQAELSSWMIPEFSDQIHYIDKYLSEEMILEEVRNGTIVINCADNNAIRKYVEDRVRSLDTAAHICGGNELRDGQVQLSMLIEGEEITPTIYNRSPGFDTDNDDRSQMNCEEMSALPGGGQLIAANMMSASLMLNFVVQILGDSNMHNGGRYIPNAYVQFDVYNQAFETLDHKEFNFAGSR